MKKPRKASEADIGDAERSQSGRKKAKKRKLTIWEKYELHKQYLQAEEEERKRKTDYRATESGANLLSEDLQGSEDGSQQEAPEEQGISGEQVAASAEVAGWELGKELAAENKAKKVPVLPWMRVPIAIDGGQGIHLEDVRGLDPRLRDCLYSDGIVELFPVQAAAWQLTAGGHSRRHDICICAPTGSGKTMAYCLPLVQWLERPKCLRGLVVVPTRDLAVQVFEVLGGLCVAVGLSCGLLAGKETERVEASMLIDHLGMSRVDAIVATPGRLISHMTKTAQFSLSQLQIMVVDEADRLLRQSYNEWLDQVLDALVDSHRLHGQQRLLKLVVSATLTQDPSKLDRLQLNCPRYIAVSSKDYRYKLPRELKEYKVKCKAEDKPLALVCLLRYLKEESTVVFTSSVEATHRLWVMLRCFEELRTKVVEFSSHLSEDQRRSSLDMFKTGAAKAGT